MTSKLTLELWYERECDRCFAEEEAKKLKKLLSDLAPHVLLDVQVLKATNVVRCKFTYEGKDYDVPNQGPSSPDRQALLITSEDIKSQGWAGPGNGCLSKQRMEEKTRQGGNSADITVHEWLHTIEGLMINGRIISHPHSNAFYGFASPSGKGLDGEDVWHDWYRYVLH